MHNLNRIRRAGLPCPEVVCLKKHVLVMKFIGQDGKPAPTLKEALLSSAQVQKAYEDTVGIMSKMYVECNLIHADLSEFNLLWFRNQVCESSFLRPFAPFLTLSLSPLLVIRGHRCQSVCPADSPQRPRLPPSRLLQRNERE